MAADPTSPPLVFISYAGPDRPIAAALGARLEQRRVRLWWDALLREDEPFERQIQRMLSDARLVVAVLSPRTLESEWVRWELAQASRNGLHILPLLTDHASLADLPPPLHLLATLTLGSEDDAMAAVAEAIAERVETLSLVPPQPRSHDARRRLASAAALTARQAAQIRERLAGGAEPSRIVVRGAGNADPSATMANCFSASEGFAAFLRQEGVALALTASQTDELYVLASSPDGSLVVDVQYFRKPTGLCVVRDSLLIGSLAHVYRLENILQPGQWMDGIYSHFYVPRIAYFTGALDVHDVGLSEEGAVFFVATRYNCLAQPSPVHSFKPVWRPPFIAQLVAEDRCHLNGLALCEGEPAFVTAVSTTDCCEGWRDQVRAGGVVYDVRSKALICEGLSLPHSPRWLGERLWLLNSGLGEVGWVERSGGGAGHFQAVARCPGFTRGLGLHGRYAFVGLSRPRYDNGMAEGLPCFSHPNADHWCGLQVIDMDAGTCVHWFRLEGPVREIFDVAVLPGVGCARVASPLEDEAMELVTIEAPASLG